MFVFVCGLGWRLWFVLLRPCELGLRFFVVCLFGMIAFRLAVVILLCGLVNSVGYGRVVCGGYLL